jgi:hypothetical protein
MKRRAVLLLAAMAAMLIVVGGTALAITYTPSKKVALKLNKPSLVATAATALYSNAIGPALTIGTDSTDSSATPLSLDTQTSEQAPMKVDSESKVDNLNADKVDGLDSTELKGQRGATGPAGATTVRTVSHESGTVAPGSSISQVVVSCSSNEEATGGGYLTSSPDVAVFQNQPIDTFLGPGWAAGFKNNGTSNQTITVYVKCASP